jgi:hypothetical protein
MSDEQNAVVDTAHDFVVVGSDKLRESSESSSTAAGEDASSTEDAVYGIFRRNTDVAISFINHVVATNPDNVTLRQRLSEVSPLLGITHPLACRFPRLPSAASGSFKLFSSFT